MLKGRDELLAAVLADQKNGLDLRAEAVVGLGTGGDLLPESRRLLLQMLAGENVKLRSEALWSLRRHVTSDVAVKRAVQTLSWTLAGLRLSLAEETLIGDWRADLLSSQQFRLLQVSHCQQPR